MSSLRFSQDLSLGRAQILRCAQDDRWRSTSGVPSPMDVKRVFIRSTEGRGQRKRPHPTQPFPRPYGYEAASEAGSYGIWMLGISAKDFDGFLSDFATLFLRAGPGIMNSVSIAENDDISILFYSLWWWDLW